MVNSVLPVYLQRVNVSLWYDWSVICIAV